MKKKVKIGNKWVGKGAPCFVIAEAGINHNGEMEKAMMLVDAAAESGTDAIKFQTHLPEKEMLKSGFTADYVGDSLFDLLKKVELSFNDHVKLKRYAERKGLIFLSTPFSREAADLLEELGVAAYKVGSGEMTNLPLLGHIAKKGKPMIVSTGMSVVEEIEEMFGYLSKLTDRLILMHCTSTYPTPYENVNLRFIPKLKEIFEIPIGLSDHSLGIYTALGSVSLGADVIEKHFTISRGWPGPDQEASLEPDELKSLVVGVRAIEKALGSSKKVTKGEKPVQKMARESVVSLVDIPKGAIIKADMVWVKRPGVGIPAKHLNEVIGCRTLRTIKADQLIKWGDIEN